MRISIGFTGSIPVCETLDAVALADELGLSGVWSAEHVGMNDSIVPATSYSLRTSSLELGLMGLNADSRSPGVLAMEVSTLHSLAPGRIRLHVGLGSLERAKALGVTEVRTVASVETFIDVLRRLTRGEVVSAESEAFVLNQMQISTVDQKLPRIPIDLMAIRPRMTTLAAKVADGLSLSVASSHTYIQRQIALVEDVLRSEGRNRNEFRVSAAVLVSIDTDIQKAKHSFASLLSGFPLSSAPLTLEGLEVPDTSRVSEVVRQEGRDAAARLFPDETIFGLGIVATPDSLGEAIGRYRADGVDELIIMLTESGSRQMEIVRQISESQS